MRQSRGVIKCQTNAERESRNGGVHGEWLDRPAQCWHKPLHCINTAESRSVEFCGGEKSHLNGTETKGKEKRPRLWSPIETHPPFRYFCVVPCPLFSLRAPLNLFPAFLLFPFQPARTPQTFPLRVPPQRTTRMDLVFRVPCVPTFYDTARNQPPPRLAAVARKNNVFDRRRIAVTAPPCCAATFHLPLVTNGLSLPLCLRRLSTCSSYSGRTTETNSTLD